MPDSTLTQAIKEAYAAAPANVVIYHTIELWHPSFTQPIRVVRDYVDLVATLEATAAHNPGAAVTFTAFNFNFTKPEVSPSGLPQITLVMDNVDRSITAAIESAQKTTDLVTLIYREFISTNLAAPQNNPPLAMSLMTAKADVFKVTATAGFPNLMNKRFPTMGYDTGVFTGLLA